MRILIAEDHFLVAEGMRLVLAEAGYKVVGVAASAPDAIRLGCTHRPDLALVDVQLAHRTSGIEAARVLHARFHIPSLLVTGNAEIARQTARDAALGCLEKPYQEQDLVAAVEMAARILRGEAPSRRINGLELFRILPLGRG